MANGTRRTSGWRRVAGANPTLGIYTEDPAVRVPYHFGLGVSDTGRISTGTRAGAVVEFPTTYTFGEALELRYRSTYTASQFQGMVLQVRSDVANTSGLRGIEVSARQNAAVAIGQLTGINSKAVINSSSTGNVTTAEGMEVGVEMGGSYTGTVANLYGLRILNDIEDGATVTAGYGLFIQTRAATGTPSGTARLTAAICISADPAGMVGVFRYGIDSTATEFTNGSGNEVVLWAFKGANGTTYYMVHDTDSATAIGVVTTDPTT